MTRSFTDIHQHLVYGIDDGPKSFKETRMMVRAAERDRIGKIIATPHVVPGVQAFDLESFLEKLDRVRVYCAQRRPDVEVFVGSEILYTEATTRFLNERRIPTLAGTDKVLVEFLPGVRYEELRSAAESLLHNGYVPIVAHIERYQCLVSHPKRAYEMKARLDIRYQVNCSTVLDGKGFFVNRFCKKLLSDGLIDVVATDAHNTNTRPARMLEAYRLLKKQYGVHYAARLTGLRGGVIPL